MTWDGKEVRFTWVPDPPDGAALLPGQWTWRVVPATGRREPHLRCPSCGKYVFLTTRWPISKTGVMLTRAGAGFGSHGNGNCKAFGRYVLVGWAEHQLSGS